MTTLAGHRWGIVRSSLRVMLALVLLSAPLLAQGCSFSASSASSSNSSAASSESSSSSSPGNREQRYMEDVRDYTASFVRSGGRLADFKTRLGEIAQQHQITNWEENLVTYEGIGRGLGKAKASQADVDTYTVNLAGNDPKKAEAIKRGYDAEK
ncbi:MAG TPA: putative lipoprotein [Verrucomicrobiae bacterium]|jgi:hypothetical protein|nr:putative lipoprotein [Verrucomicrobiae bacterium]